MAPGLDDVLVDHHVDALSIGQLYNEVEGALARAFPKPRPLWVRGEIQSISTHRTGHCYMELIDPDVRREPGSPVLKVKCWKTAWAPLRRSLAREGIELAQGMVVLLRGTVDFYRPRAEISFILAELDVTALLGRLAAQRAALLRTLAAEGLLEANRRLVVPPVPLTVGLVASPGTEGYHDFVGQLEGSGFGFRILLVPAAMQGQPAAGQVVRGLRTLAGRPCDLVVVVRGGGSKADLSAFDAEPVARAIASCPVPVWTGIGHTGDESVADLVANRAFVTPTDCGDELARRVTEWWEAQVADPARRLDRRATEVLDGAGQSHHLARRQLTNAVGHQLRWHQQRLVNRTERVVERAPRVVTDAHQAVVARAAALGPLAEGHVARATDRQLAWRRLLAAYDVDRQLERGYTLTLDRHGRVLRSVAGLSPGDPLVTRLADGEVRSTVDAAAARPGGDDR